MRISLVAHGHKPFLRDPVHDVLVHLAVSGDGDVRDGFSSPFRRVIVPSPDLDVVWQRQELPCGLVQRVSASAGKIAPRGADIDIEQGIAAKDVVCVDY